MTSAGFEGRSPRRRAETLASAPFCRFCPLRAKNSPALTALWPLKRTYCHQWTLALWQFYSGAWQSKSRFYTAQDYLEGKEKHEVLHPRSEGERVVAMKKFTISSMPATAMPCIVSAPSPNTSKHTCWANPGAQQDQSQVLTCAAAPTLKEDISSSGVSYRKCLPLGFTKQHICCSTSLQQTMYDHPSDRAVCRENSTGAYKKRVRKKGGGKQKRWRGYYFSMREKGGGGSKKKTNSLFTMFDRDKVVASGKI